MIMSGVSGWLKDKKSEWEDKKVNKIQNMIDQKFGDFKKGLEKQLGKLGLSLTYAGISGSNARARTGGTLIARFNDSQGYPITLFVSQQVYEGHPAGNLGFGDMLKVYWSWAIWGTIVPSSIPFTMLFKEVGRGFLKDMDKVFLPFAKDPSLAYAVGSPDEKKLFNSPLLQTPVIAALNSDKKTCDNIAKLSLWCEVYLTHKASLTLKCEDMAGKCSVVPFGDETAVFLRNYGNYGDPKRILETMAGIRRNILANPHTEKVNGLVPVPWVENLHTICKATSLG